MLLQPSINTPTMPSHEGRRLSPTRLSALAAPRAPDSESHPHPATTRSAIALHSAANATSSHLHAALPPLNTDDPSDPSLPRFHIRNPSAALSLNTDVLFMKAAERLQHETTTTTTVADGATADALRHSATAPIAIQDGYLRSTFSAGSMTGSLSPGSAFSSPALNALVDLTPLPSPLVMSDSPGSWTRGGVSFRPRSRGTSGSSRDDSFAMFSRGGTLSPSPSLKKKGHQKLKTAGEQAVDASMQTQHKSDASRERHRSVSEFRPDAMHNIGLRHVTISNVAPQTAQPDTTFESQLHREAYLAARRGLVPAGLPTPPASNRSVTESEEDDVAEDDKIDYITVRQGPHMVKKLWRPVRQLGQGTFSKVWLATSEKRSANDPLEETTLDPRKLVAIKVVEHGPAGGADEERVELSLKREVEMLRSVSHPSLVHLRAFDNGDSQALLVLTYCPGGDLFDVASTNRDLLGVDLVQRIFAELVSATRYLHDKLIVHRDIKLESISHRSVCAGQPVLISHQMSCLIFPSPQYPYSKTHVHIRIP